MFKLSFFVPESHVEATKNAVFESGAGKMGDYDSCAWQTRGQGQFRPLPGSAPHLGQHGHVEYVAEYKVEMVCSEEVIHAAIAALKLAHPYEEPAYEVYRLEPL